MDASAPLQVEEPARSTPVIGRAEVIVLGGGPSGIAAAIAAARAGRRTILVERYGFLGGMGTAGMVTSFCGLHANVHGDIRQVVHGLPDELLDRLRARDGLNRVHTVMGRTHAQSYDCAVYKTVCDDLLSSAHVDLHLHALAVGAVLRGQQLGALLVETKSGRGALVGDVFIDASGDADLAAWAGVGYEKSAELAYPTTMFRVGNVDDERALTIGKPQIRRFFEEARAAGDLAPPRLPYLNPQVHAREWRVNATQAERGGRAVDGTLHDDLREGEVSGRRQALEVLAFLRKRVPGFEDTYLMELGPQLGIRETRRILGRYQLTAADVLGAASFGDGIGVNGWPVEQHVAGEVTWDFIAGRGYHEIPFRCLVPADGPTNLLVVGRCASATQGGQSSLRVSGPCFQMGQAAGRAAAIAGGEQAVGDVDLAVLRAALVDDGVFLG